MNIFFSMTVMQSVIFGLEWLTLGIGKGTFSGPPLLTSFEILHFEIMRNDQERHRNQTRAIPC